LTGETERGDYGHEQESAGSLVRILLLNDETDPAQEVNIQNMNVELVAQMFKNYQSNVLFHLEGMTPFAIQRLFLTD
jgi:hypothetical protein